MKEGMVGYKNGTITFVAGNVFAFLIIGSFGGLPVVLSLISEASFSIESFCALSLFLLWGAFSWTLCCFSPDC